MCEKILRALPNWFGIESSILDYIKEVQRLETFIAADAEAIGFLSINKPNKSTAEIFVMGILPEHHGKKIGNELISAAERSLQRQGFKFLTVKTVSESRSNAEYDKTRRFYSRAGFLPLEEFKTLWGAENPCLMLCKPIAPADDSRPIATEFTLRFLNEFIPPSAKVLEVGCGLGHLAVQLCRQGHDVLAIDISETAIASTRLKGVRAEQIKIEEVDEKDFDSILFTRSLHHIHPIDSCLDKAARLLKPNGSIIIEDFGYDLMDEATALWYQSLRNVVSPVVKNDEWHTPAGEALEHWMKHHPGDHQLHKAAKLEREIRSRFSDVRVFPNQPYLFRYFVGQNGLPLKSVESIFSWEQQLISEGRIKGIGLRIVGSKGRNL